MAVVEKTTIYLDAEHQRRLRALAKRLGRPQAELIREAIAEYLGRRAESRLPSWVGMVKDGPVTDSSTIKQELRATWADELERKHDRDR